MLTGTCDAVPPMRCMLWHTLQAASVLRRTQGQQLHVSKAPHLSCRSTSLRLHLADQLILLLAQLSDLTAQVLPALPGAAQLLKPLHVLHRELDHVGSRPMFPLSMLQLPVLEVPLMPRESATPQQFHMSRCLVSFASLGWTLSLSSIFFPVSCTLTPQAPTSSLPAPACSPSWL